jgi:hypothetical protein
VQQNWLVELSRQAKFIRLGLCFFPIKKAVGSATHGLSGNLLFIESYGEPENDGQPSLDKKRKRARLSNKAASSARSQAKQLIMKPQCFALLFIVF